MIKRLIAAGILAIAMMVPSALAHNDPFAKWKIRQPVVQLTIENIGSCSGVVVSKGLVLTAGHCVIANEEDNATLPLFVVRDGWVYPTKVVKVDYQKDIALIAADIDCPCAPVSQFKPVADEKLYVVGYPYGREINNTQIVTEGHYQGQMKNGDYITTVPAAPGNSGGGLFNQYGELVGILVAGIPPSTITFSVSLDVIKKILDK